MSQSMQLDWNPGGWFGSRLGGTVWILIAATIASRHDSATAAMLFVLFLVANTAGLILWQRRKLSCYASIQILFAFCGCFGLLAILVLDRNDLWLAVQQGGAVFDEAGYFLLSVTVIIVMISLHLKFGGKPGDPPA